MKQFSKEYDDNSLEVEKDCTFKSLNRASEFCLGRSPNAWIEWKNNKKRTY
ncbi:MAG: DUF4357 domain-containing protein [Thermales bacterium]|nr:DUF4357 domain-containing protein [Thermales bacterium]